MNLSLLFALLFLTISCGSKIAIELGSGIITVSSPSNFNVSNIVIANDTKSITITGTGLTSVTSASMLRASDNSLIDNMLIDSKANTQIILKPSLNLSLDTSEIKIRLL